MDWSNDDLEFNSNRKVVAKKGRRAGLLSTLGSDQDTSSNFAESTNSTLDSPPTPKEDIPQAPPRARKTGGWADDATKSAKNKTSTNIIEQERFRVLYSEGSDDDIPVIPDVDDIPEEMLSLGVAKATSLAVNRVATYKELDSDLLQQGAFASLDNVDLSLLTKSLHQEAEIKESDEPWPWDKLFTEIAGELHQREETTISS